MMTRNRALANYITKFGGRFPCSHRVEPDGSNVQFSKANDRRKPGRVYWRLRCLHCNRKTARDGMFLLRLDAMAEREGVR